MCDSISLPIHILTTLPHILTLPSNIYLSVIFFFSSFCASCDCCCCCLFAVLRLVLPPHSLTLHSFGTLARRVNCIFFICVIITTLITHRLFSAVLVACCVLALKDISSGYRLSPDTYSSGRHIFTISAFRWLLFGK